MSTFIACARPSTRAPGWIQYLKAAALALIAVLAVGCGGGDGGNAGGGNGGGGNGGGGPQPQGCSDCGTAVLTITDAPGDFRSYAIDVVSLKLVKANGTAVETLPATTRIDFAELVDLGEVLSATQIPAGVYVSATLRVDYSDAEIMVEDALGGSVQVDPVDAAGNPLGIVDLRVQLDNRNRLVITARRVSHLSFDLNLDASNTVNLAQGTVSVDPFIVASVQPPEERDLRIRGRLRSVDVAGGSYTVQVRPFHHRDHSTGELVVHTTNATSFEIDGVAYRGEAGLAQLATLPTGTLVIAFGTLATSDWRFTAKRVLAGSGLDDLRREYLSGNVIARDGNTLLVGAVRLYWDPSPASTDDHYRRHGRYLRAPVSLLVDSGTKVTRAGQGDGVLDIDDISVGQRIQAIGDVSRDGEDGFVMDATSGLVRLDYTRLTGLVTASEVGALTLDLASIDGIHAGRFDFAGTGLTALQDADPDAYEVAVAAGLSTAALQPGAWTRVFGFVSPFGMAPPDFNAATLLDYSDTRAAAGVLWLPAGTTTPFGAISVSGLMLDMGLVPPPVGGIRTGAAFLGLSQLPAPLTFAAADTTRHAFAIAHRASHEIENFSDFGEFVAALDAALDGQTRLYKLHAYGSYSAPGVTFNARQLLVVLGD